MVSLRLKVHTYKQRAGCKKEMKTISSTALRDCCAEAEEVWNRKRNDFRKETEPHLGGAGEGTEQFEQGGESR